MKLSTLIRRAAGWLSIIVLSGLMGFVYDLHDVQRTFAADGISVTINATGVNGPIVLSTETNTGVNTGNPVPIPATGKVSFSMTWAPKGSFAPQSCFAYTDTKLSNGNTYPGNAQGSGFIVPQQNGLPTSQTNYQVQGNLVPYGTSTRVIYLQCDNNNNNTHYWARFNLIFQAAAGITGECKAGQGFVWGYSGGTTNEVWSMTGAFGDGSSYARDDGNTGLVCSEVRSTIEPEAFCGRRCQNYNPARSFQQPDGSYRICNNINDTQSPLYVQFGTWVTGPNSYTPTIDQGTTLPFNAQIQGGGGGEMISSIRIGNWTGSYSNYHTDFTDPFFSSWIFNSSETGRNPDYDAFSAINDALSAGLPAGDSFRSGTNCRANSVAARTITDSQSSAEETFAYFQQQYRRDGQRNGNGEQRLWGPQEKALYPFVQAEDPRLNVSVAGGVEGVDYTVNRDNPNLYTSNNGITFLNTGNYTVTIKQEAFSAAVMVCQMPLNSSPQPKAQNPPYNCGGNAQRIQQFRGVQFPAMTTTYQVRVNPSGNGSSPTGQLTINGVTADASNPNRITTVSLPAGPNQNPVADTLDASWVATNVPANSCKVDRQDPQNGITVTSNPWKDRQTGLPISNASAPLTFDNILRGSSTDTTFTLICGTGANTVTRTIEVRLSRDGSAPSAALSLTLRDPRSGASYTADATNPTQTGDVTPFSVGDAAALTAEWQGNTGLLDNSCTVTKMGANPPSVTAQGEPWQSGASNQAITGAPQTVTLVGLDTPSTDAQIQFLITCKKLDGTNLARTVNLTVHRAAAPPPSYSISGHVKYDDNSVAPDHDLTITGGGSTTSDSTGLYGFSNLLNGVYTITVTPNTDESCVSSCSQTATISNGDVSDIDFSLHKTGGNNGGSTAGSVLNGGSGSRSF